MKGLKAKIAEWLAPPPPTCERHPWSRLIGSDCQQCIGEEARAALLRSRQEALNALAERVAADERHDASKQAGEVAFLRELTTRLQAQIERLQAQVISMADLRAAANAERMTAPRPPGQDRIRLADYEAAIGSVPWAGSLYADGHASAPGELEILTAEQLRGPSTNGDEG